jgi:hypothetical protein
MNMIIDDSSNTVRAGVPLSVMAHEAGCGLSKSSNRVRVCMSFNRVKKLPYLYGSSPYYKSSILNSIKGIRISSEKPHINKARLDIGFLLSGGPKPV